MTANAPQSSGLLYEGEAYRKTDQKTAKRPLLCTTSFGAPLQLEDGEDKALFLARTRDALLALAPEHS